MATASEARQDDGRVSEAAQPKHARDTGPYKDRRSPALWLATVRRLGWTGWLLGLATVVTLIAVMWTALFQPWIDRGKDYPPSWTEWTAGPLPHDRGWLAPVSHQAWRLEVQNLIKDVSLGSSVNAVAFSPDGMRFGTGGDDGTIRLWTLDGKPLATLEGHLAAVKAIAFSPDGNRLVSGSEDGNVKLWTLGGGEPVTFEGHSDAVRSVVFSPDGARILSGSQDGTIRIWTLQGKQVAKLEGHKGWVFAAVFSPDGMRIASAGSDGIRLWNADGAALSEWKSNDSPVYAVAFAPNGLQLASGGQDGAVRLWTLEGKEQGSFEQDSPVTALAFSPDGTRIAAASNRTLLLAADGKLLSKFGDEGDVNAVVFSKDGTRVAAGGIDGKARLWTLDGKELASVAGHGGWSPMALSRDGTRIATGAMDGAVRLWTVEGKELARLQAEPSYVSDIAFSADGKRIVSGYGDGSLRLWTSDGMKLATLVDYEGAIQISPDYKDSVNSVAFSPDGTRIAFAGQDGAVRLWTPDDKQQTLLIGRDSPMLALAFSPDGRRIATGGTGNSIRLWSTDAKELMRIDARTAVYALAFSPDGTQIASGGDGAALSLWTIEGKKQAELEGHSSTVTAVAYSADGKQVISAGEDGTVRLWDDQGHDLATYFPAQFWIGSIGVSPDLIAASDRAGRVHILKPHLGFLAPAPWTWPGGLIGLVLALLFRRVWRSAMQEEIDSHKLKPAVPLPAAASFLDAESPINDPRNAGEALNQSANRIATFILNPNTSTPVTFAVAGKWGTGKTSLMRLTQALLHRAHRPTVWFNAWHHQGEEHLFAALMEAIRKEAAPSVLSFAAFQPHHLAFRWRLLLARVKATPFRYAFRVAIAVFVVALVWYLRAIADTANLGPFAVLAPLKDGLLSFAVPLAAGWLAVRDLLKPFLAQPAALLEKAEGWLSTQRFTDRLDFRQSFGAAFGEVCIALGDRRLTIFIDDLDRCQPERVVETLEAVNFLTTNGDCFVILGMSEDPVKHAVGLSFEKVAAESAAADAAERGIKPVDGVVARAKFASFYLEKLITLRVPVPPFDGAALRIYLTRGSGKEPGEWAEQLVRSWPRLAPERAMAVEQAARHWLWVVPFLAVLGLGLWTAIPLAQWTAEAVKESSKKAAEDKAGEQSKHGSLIYKENPATPPTTAPPVPDGKGGGSDQENGGGTTAGGQTDNGKGDARNDGSKSGGSEAKPRDFFDWAPWLALAAILLAALLSFSPRLRKLLLRAVKMDEPGVKADSNAFRESFARWVPLVLEVRDSPRAVKRFANRMRFLASGLTDDVFVWRLMALGALDEVEAVAPGDPLQKVQDFNIGSLLTNPREAGADVGEMQRDLAAVTPQDWDRYQDLDQSSLLRRRAPQASSPPAAKPSQIKKKPGKGKTVGPALKRS